jgi:hypothetical protein
MFHPVEHPMERGWVGRIEDDHVVHLAAQSLQAFFTGGGTAREHAVYPRQGVRLLAPVLHPPAVRVFDGARSFAFANPAAIVGPGAEVCSPEGSERLELLARIAAVIGADGAIGGYSVFAEWRDPARPVPKDRDFALGLGPVVLTAESFGPGEPEGVVRVDGAETLRASFAASDWEEARRVAADGTTLLPGDLLAGPALEPVAVPAGAWVEVEVGAIGTLDASVAA